jgi:hypothetical protein
VAYNPTLYDDIDNVLIQAQIPTGLGRGDFLRLRNCTIEQQALIIQYAVDMICDGNKPEHTAQVCASMAILCQDELRNPLEGCSPDHQAFIMQHGMDMLKGDHKPEFVARVCADTAILCQGELRNPLEGCTPEQQGYIIQYGMDMIRDGDKPEQTVQVCTDMVDLIQHGSLDPLGICSPEQQTSILQYGMDMIVDGNKPEWAAQVCASMAILYQSVIEAYIPDQILIENNQQPYCIEYFKDANEGVVFGPQFIKQRTVATERLGQIMNANGANYSIISDYLKQQREDSWNNECCTMKYFLLQQRANVEQDGNIYYFGEVTLEDLRQRYNEHFGLPDQLKEDLLKQYPKTVAMYKAYTATALRKTQIGGFDGKDSTQQTYKLQKGMNRKRLIEFYPALDQQPAYKNVQPDETFGRMKGGIADSVELGPPVFTFNKPNYDVLEIQVPFCKIHVVYFVSPELCYDDDLESKNDTEVWFAGGHEFVCDTNGIPVTLKKMASKEESSEDEA